MPLINRSVFTSHLFAAQNSIKISNENFLRFLVCHVSQYLTCLTVLQIKKRYQTLYTNKLNGEKLYQHCQKGS
jgi:hypothetical protein